MATSTMMDMTEPLGSREKLILATIELIASKGYDSTGINEILAQSGVTKSNFYYHFDSKEVLCLEALDSLIDCATREILHGVFSSQANSPKQRFQSFLDYLHQKFSESCCAQGCPMVNLATETSDFYPPFREKLDQFFGDYARSIESWYQEGVEKGEFRDDLSPSKVAQLVLSTINGTMVMTKTLKTPDIIKNNGEVLLMFLSK